MSHAAGEHFQHQHVLKNLAAALAAPEILPVKEADDLAVHISVSHEYPVLGQQDFPGGIAVIDCQDLVRVDLDDASGRRPPVRSVDQDDIAGLHFGHRDHKEEFLADIEYKVHTVGQPAGGHIIGPVFIAGLDSHLTVYGQPAHAGRQVAEHSSKHFSKHVICHNGPPFLSCGTYVLYDYKYTRFTFSVHMTISIFSEI